MRNILLLLIFLAILYPDKIRFGIAGFVDIIVWLFAMAITYVIAITYIVTTNATAVLSIVGFFAVAGVLFILARAFDDWNNARQATKEADIAARAARDE